MTDPWPFRSSLELGALSSAVPCACLHVKHVLWEWGLNSLAERAELVVSELVTNAVTATGQPGQTVLVNLAGTGTGPGTRVLIEVREAAPRARSSAANWPRILPRPHPCPAGCGAPGRSRGPRS